MKREIIESIGPVVDDPCCVEIDRDKIGEFCRRQDPREIELPDWRDPFIYPWDNEAAADFFLLFNTINFAFWAKGETEKWNTEYKGRKLDGAYGLMGALTRALEEGVPLLDGAFLREMTEESLREILGGSGELVLFYERVQILREVGQVLVSRYGGSFAGLRKAAGKSAPGLARLLISEFPSFNDVCWMNGAEIKFYKRAQLAPAMIYQRFQGEGAGDFIDIDDLTVFADYKLPQVLRRLGILEYHPDLAGKVDSRVLIPKCSREEVEIRASTIRACELIIEEYAAAGVSVNSARLDAFLWLLGHRKSRDTRPYHLTETIYY